jgi:hypothetical protein
MIKKLIGYLCSISILATPIFLDCQHQAKESVAIETFSYANENSLTLATFNTLSSNSKNDICSNFPFKKSKVRIMKK